jgi:hypothetical protein
VKDPLSILAMQRIVAQSADIEAQLSVLHGCRPVLTVLIMARDRAAAALGSLATVDPEDPKQIRFLQNEVGRFADLVEFFGVIVQSGFDFDQEISSAEREEMIDMLSRSTEGQEELEDLGLLQREANDA